MIKAADIPPNAQAALDFLQSLDATGYDFVPVTPATHARILSRPDMTMARNLRDVFGWSLPFGEGVVPPDLIETMRKAGFLVEERGRWRSAVRASRVEKLLFLHSAFPTVADDSVFLGPDTIRFATFLKAHLPGAAARIVDIGAGAGVGGIIAGRAVTGSQVELVDINPAALRLARVNAAAAGQMVATIQGDGMADVAAGFDLTIANPPFIIDQDGPAYRAGGAMHGAETSLRWAIEAAAAVAPGGRVLMYSGSAIVDGRDGLRDALLSRVESVGCTLDYFEIDPDIFGEELEKPAYREVERIAAIGCVIRRN